MNVGKAKLKISNYSLYSFAVQLLVCALVLFYFTDGLFKIFDRTAFSTYRFGPIVKGLFLAVVLLYSVFTLKKSKISIVLWIGVLISFFLVGQLFLSFSLKDIGFFENINTLIKYLSPIIYFLLVVDIIRLKIYPEKLLKYYKIIISFNSLLMIIGLLGVYFLQTYESNFRFGYDGLIYAQNEASYIFVFAIAFHTYY